MEEKHIHRLRIRRGSNSQRKEVMFEDGEFVYVYDIEKLYVGDMKSIGGIKVSNNNQVILKNEKPISADIGDILYNKLNKSTYIVNKKNELQLINISINDIFKYLKQIEELEALLDNLEKFCCNKDFALDTDDGVNILADYGDWLRVKYPDLSVVSCKPPIISSKYLKLKTNKVYTLDITNFNSDSDILFFDNLVDRDINEINQNINIIQDSVTSSNNLKILEITNNTIKFSVDPLPLDVVVGTGIYIDYDIQNDCGSIEKEKGKIGGVVYNNNATIYTTKLDEYKEYTSNKIYSMYQVLDPTTNQYPWDKECWFLFYFDSKDLSDSYYITMFDKSPDISTGDINVNTYSYGSIGPIFNKGIYLFWHPKDTDLNIWNKGNGVNSWSVFPVYNTDEHPNSPNRFFQNVNIKPTSQQIISMLNDKGLTYEKDYTSIYTDTTVPSFIKIF